MYRRYFYLLVLLFVSEFLAAQPPCPGAIASFPYHETFETSNGNWTPGGTGSDWAWGSPTKPVISAAGEGNKCWITGGLTVPFYNNGENSFLQSPCFDFTVLVNPRISFKIFWETEKKFDGAALQYSTDNGTVWNLLGTTNSNATCLGVNWYNTTGVTYLGNTQGWSGNVQSNGGSCSTGNGSGSWLTASHDLSMLAGKPNVQFRFIFGAGTQCNAFDGFAFDDVSIFEAPLNTSTFTFTCKPLRTVDFSNQSICPVTSSWNFGDPGSGVNNTAAATNPTHQFSAAGMYTVTLTSTFISGPPSTTTKQVTILDVTTSLDHTVSCNGANDALISAVASGSTAAYAYTWNTTPPQSTPAITVGPGSYFVTVNSGAACAAVSPAITVTEPPILTVSPVVSDQQCAATNGSIISNAGGGTPGYTYLWNTGANTPDLHNLVAGTYSLQVTDSKGCNINTGNLTVAHNTGNLSVNLGSDAVICPGTTLVLNPGNFATYLWQDNTTSPVYNVTITGTYSVSVTDANGCTGSGSIHVTVDCSDIYFPTAFTPNGDTKNETFGPAGNNLSLVKNYELNIYNRYGELIFLSTDPYKKWNGRVGGKISGNETFVWMVSYSINGDNRSKKGTVIRIK